MTALSQTLADLTATLSAGSAPAGQAVFLEDSRIGWVGPCDAAGTPTAWKWSVYSSFGYGPTKAAVVADMVAYLEREHPVQLAIAKAEAEERARIEAMPDHIRSLYLEWVHASRSAEIERVRGYRRDADLAAAERWERRAKAAYDDAAARQMEAA